MKRLVLSRAVLLIGLFVAGQSFVPTADGAVGAASMAEELNVMGIVANVTASKTGKVGDANVPGSGGEARSLSRSFEGVGDVNVTVADANAAVEPNAEDPQAKMLEDIEKAFGNLKRGSQKEERGWVQLKAEKKMQLAKAVQEQLLAELDVLREIAVEEEAVKTTAAIDMLIADRQGRFEKVLERMKAEDEKMQRREQLRNKRERGDRERDKERVRRRKD